MLRLGIISEMGTGDNLGYARVWFDDRDIVSGWLAIPSISTHVTKQWVPVEVNSQVACLMDDRCEQGVIVMVLWSDSDTPPSWAGPDTMGVKFKDGTELFYDMAERRLSVNAPGAELTLKCAKLNIDGEVSVNGTITATGEVTAGATNIKLSTHTHPTGVGPSGTPIP